MTKDKLVQRHHLPGLLTAAADLLDHLGPVTGLRLGLHTTLPEGVRLLVKTGRPYTDEVGPLDQIGASLGASITHDRADGLTLSHVTGTWKGTPAYGSHLSATSQPAGDKPCTQSAAELARRVRGLIPWARKEWARWAESLHVYDESGTPCVHAVLKPEGSLDTTLADFLDATGLLQYAHDRKHDYVVHGSVLLDDGTVVTTSVIT
ncbi:hypothetical protein ACF1FX_34485 [Streptomyces sp. NPDC014646]|uniref:hypothetical protein n=1 Tax=Streptomyces sp. NPDC014646 TaxID=3364877 RepID=UPI0036F8FCA3